jgi:hypothetical protein
MEISPLLLWELAKAIHSLDDLLWRTETVDFGAIDWRVARLKALYREIAGHDIEGLFVGHDRLGDVRLPPRK